MLRSSRMPRAPRSRFSLRPWFEPLEDRFVPATPGFFQQTNLVADQPAVAALHDPEFVGGWGVSISAGGGAVWMSAHGAGVSTLYTGDVAGSPVVKNALTVAIPGGAPTGQVFNSNASDFTVSAGGGSGRAIFLFATADGDITGWNPGVPPPPLSRTAVVGAHTDGAVYTGLAIANTTAGDRLFAADYQNGKIDVFDSSFQNVTAAGSFEDPRLPRAYHPFNVQALGNELYVTYARRDGDGDHKPDGGTGFVNVFDRDGNLLRRLASGQHLKGPWGLALAPADFGPFGGAVLVGNTLNGQISAFDPASGKFLGRLDDGRGKPIRIDGLFGLTFGNGVSFGDKNALYFLAGPDEGEHGLMGSLRFVAQPPGRVEALLNDVIGALKELLAKLERHVNVLAAPLPDAGTPAATGQAVSILFAQAADSLQELDAPLEATAPAADVFGDLAALLARRK